MKRLYLAVFMILPLLNPLTAESADVVTLSEKAFVSGEQIYLKDVAALQGPNEQELGLTALMRSPKGQIGVNLSSAFVAQKIREYHPGWQATMKGSPNVYVSEKLTKISEEELEAVYKDAVMKNSPWKEKGSLVIKDVKAPPYVSVPEKDRDLIQAKFSPREDFLGLTTASITFGLETTPTVIRVSGKIQVIAEVPLAKANIARGEVISEADIEMQQIDISISPLIITDKGDCLGKRAKTMLQAGKPILKSNIEQPPVINRGELVAIEARAEGLVIRDKGIALKDGYLHERIPVRNASSGKQILGTIIAASRVEVTF